MKHLKAFFALLLLSFAIAATSCHTVKRACATLDQHPIERAAYCASKYVPTESTKTTIKYLPGKTVKVPGEAVYIEYNCDSAIQSEMDRLAAIGKTRRPQPFTIKVPTYLRVDTAAIQMETVRDNVAALAYRDSVISSLTLACNTAGKDLDTAKMDKNKWRSRALWTWTGIAFILLAGTAYRLLRSQYAKKANAVKDLLS